jgi:hypothetical protein
MKRKLFRVSMVHRRLPVQAVPSVAGWIVTCMTGNASFPNPPIPLKPATPPDPTAPVDMTTRIDTLEVAISNYEDGGQQALLARNAAWEAVISGLDALAFYVSQIGRYDLDVLLSSGFQAVSTNHGQSKLDTPSISSISNDTPTELDVHVTAITNAYGYEVQTSVTGSDWKTVKYSQQARIITLTGLTTGQVVNVRVRALGGSTGQSDWSMPGSSIVD